MDTIEKAIRAALEKGNPEDKAFRQKIYRSAELALTRSLSARADVDASTKQARLAHLTRVVALIETEFTPAVAPNVDADVRLRPRAADHSIASSNSQAQKPYPKQEPQFEKDSIEPDWSRSPKSGRGDGDTSTLVNKRAGKTPVYDNDDDARRSSGNLFRKLVTAFILITILALVVMFGWTAWNSSLFGNAADDGSGPAKINQSEDSTNSAPQQLGSGDPESENWVTVFEPRDASSVQASDGLTAELLGSGSAAYLRIFNTKNTTQGEATFEIGRGVLETLRGKKIVFNLQAKTTDGATTQMAASCSLAGMGECQRVRFRLEGQLTENLIIVQLADTAPEASGTLTIMPDIDKTGNPVELVAIRVRIEK